MSDKVGERIQRKCQLLNNPLKQRGHTEFNMNLLSEGIQGILCSPQRTKMARYEKTLNADEEKLEDIKKVGIYHKYSQSMATLSAKNATQSDFDPSSKVLIHGIKLKPIQSDSGNIFKTEADETQPRLKINNKINFKFDISLAKTTYFDFFKNPSTIKNSQEKIMKPNFYQSPVPKYLNIDYAKQSHDLERINYGYKEPSVVKVRDYDPNSDFRKRALITDNGRYKRTIPKAKHYI